MALNTETDIQEIRNALDAEGDQAHAATDERLESVRQELGNFSGGIDGEETDDTTGSTLPSNDVPDGVEVAVQAKYGNQSRIKVGLTSTPTVELQPGATATYRVENTDQIHIVAKSNGDGVAYTAEV